MKVIHLISGGDSGGAKTHVFSLLRGLSRHIQADMVCFTEGPFAQQARELGISVEVMAGRNIPAILRRLKKRIGREGYDIIHCHGARGNLMGALLRRSTGLPVVTTVHSDPRLDYMGRFFGRLVFGSVLPDTVYTICSQTLPENFRRLCLFAILHPLLYK